MSNLPEKYIPYETTARELTREDKSVGEFVLSVFPGANKQALEKFQDFIAGKIHDGIEVGLSIAGTQYSYDPITPIEAYNLGQNEGYKRAYLEIISNDSDEN